MYFSIRDDILYLILLHTEKSVGTDFTWVHLGPVYFYEIGAN